jgi:site-specific DNA recombinase
MKGVIYCRVSSKEQVEGTSLESQLQACEEFARAKNIPVLKTFIEQGESAKFADRTQLLELIEFCRCNKPEVQVLLVWKVDRFARNVADHFSIKATLLKYGVHIVSVTEPIDSNPEGRLMETILAGFAQFDNDVRAMRTVQGMRRKIQEGIFPWKPPLGYKGANVPGEKKTKPDTPDQPLFGLLQKAWEDFATGAYTKTEMRHLMNANGIVTRKGRPLSDQSIDNLFANPFYAGIIMDPWSKEEHTGMHVPMISRADFERVQQVVRRRSQAIPHHRYHVQFPVRGLVRCPECLQYLTASFSRGRSKRYPYYHCHNDACSRRGKVLPAGDIDQEFRAHLGRIAPKPELIDRLGDRIEAQAEERKSSSKARRARASAAVNRVTRELQELVRMRAATLITDEEFNRHRSTLLSERSLNEIAADDMHIATARVRQKLTEIAEPLSDLVLTWTDLTVPSRVRFERLIFPVGFIAGKIRTAELGLIFSTKRGILSEENHGVAPTVSDSNQLCEEINEFWRILKGLEDEKEEHSKRVRRKSQNVTRRAWFESTAKRKDDTRPDFRKAA